MTYLEPDRREEVGTGFHFTKADRAKQQQATLRSQSTVNTGRDDTSRGPTAGQQPHGNGEHGSSSMLSERSRRCRRIFVVGDQNLIGSEIQSDGTEQPLPARMCVGALLQQHVNAHTSGALHQQHGDMQVRVASV